MSNPASSHVNSMPLESDLSKYNVQKISMDDLRDALRLGWNDFKAVPTHAILLALIYPVLGIVLARTVLGYSILPLLFPLAAGFALLGPFAALGFYDLSRRRERGEAPTASHALGVLRSPSIAAMTAFGVALLVLFLVWLAAAQSIYSATFGYAPASSFPDFFNRVLTTSEGHRLIVMGCGVGFLFALVVLAISVVSFPMLVDRSDVSVMTAVRTSVRAALENPVPIALWGLIVAGMLLLGAIPLLIGLTIALPILGHATWHLYRKLVPRDGATLNPN